MESTLNNAYGEIPLIVRLLNLLQKIGEPPKLVVQ